MADWTGDWSMVDVTTLGQQPHMAPEDRETGEGRTVRTSKIAYIYYCIILQGS